MLAMAAEGSKSSLLASRSKSERRPALSMHQSSDYLENEKERGRVRGRVKCEISQSNLCQT